MTSLPSPARTAPGSLETTERLIDRVAARIAPFFDAGQGSTEVMLRAAARHVLLDYRPVTGKELQLAAQITALSMATIGCLSMAAGRLPVDDLLRIQNDAIKLSRLNDKLSTLLTTLQAARSRSQSLPADRTAFDEAEFNAVISLARDKVAYARAKQEAHQVAVALEAAPAAKANATPPAPMKAAKPRAAVPPPPPVEEAWAKILREMAASATLH